METHGLGAKGIKMIVDDVFARASFVLNAKVLDPQFQGQTKEKLISRDALKLVSSFVRPQMEFWLNSHVEEGRKLAEMFIKQAQARQHSAQKIEKRKGSSVAVLPGKLTDCTSGFILNRFCRRIRCHSARLVRLWSHLNQCGSTVV